MVRVFRGREMGPVLERIKAELGEEAIIISSGTVAHNGEKVIEVRARRGAEAAAPTVTSQAPAARAQRAEPRPAQPQSIVTPIARSALPGLPAGMAAEIQRLAGPAADRMAAVEPLIAQRIRFDPRMPRNGRVIALIGPPGAGKTTIATKLAASLARIPDMRIGMISADGFRVGGGYQLQTYAHLLQVPHAMATQRERYVEQVTSALSNFADCDLVLVDCPATSARDSAERNALQRLIASDEDYEPVAVLPASMNPRDMQDWLATHRGYGAERLILTKLDESAEPSNALGAAVALQLQLAFFSLGTRVPEDIEVATARRVSWLLCSQLQRPPIAQ